MPRKTDSHNPADWLLLAASDMDMVRLSAEKEISFFGARSKLAEILEKTLKAELLRIGWQLEGCHATTKLDARPDVWGSLTEVVGGVLRDRMTRPFSVRARPSVIAAMDARAAALGQDRSAYILALVERDLAAQGADRRHRFASEDLIGSVQTGLASGESATVRRLARQRLRETHR